MINKKLLAASMAAVVSGGIATQVHAIKVQENGIGQLLLGSTYIASGDLSTNLVVVNTRTDAAVKVKVVFREGKTSEEVIDFFLYLTPGDVWRGSVTGEVNAAYIESTDDSMTDDSGAFASASNPVKQAFNDKSNSGQNGYGHFEIIGLYSVSVGSYPVGSSTVTVAPAMSKSNLKSIFDTITTAGGPGADASALSSAIMPGQLQISGEVGIAAAGANTATFPMVAVGPTNYSWGNNFVAAPNNTLPAGSYLTSAGCATTAGYTCFTNYVVTNANFDATLAALTDIGVGFGTAGGGDSSDHIVAIEAALTAADLTAAYNVSELASTGVTITFPTKYRHFGANVCSAFSGGTAQSITDSSGSTVYTAPFANTTSGSVTYTTTSYDNSENSATASTSQFSGGTSAPAATLSLEVNYISPAYFSTSGQVRFTLNPSNASTGCGTYYNGLPVLGATLKGNTAGNAFNWQETGDRRWGM